MTDVPRLCLFDRWMDPVASGYLTDHAPQLGVSILSFADGDDHNWSTLSAAHGYQCLPSTETPEKFYPTADLLARCPDLLAVSVAGAGYDMVDVDACTAAGVLVFNQSGANAESVAQHALGMMLTLCKQMIQSDRAIHSEDRNWDRWTYMGSELTGRTLGIIGLGNVGRRLSAICGSAFNMRVIACDPYISDQDFIDRGAEKASLETVMSEADFVSIHCPLTDETSNMIGAPQFDMMKSEAYFVSTARGGIHDEEALEAVLASGRISGAGLDVFVEEPPVHTHPLLAYPNVIVSPHNAGITSDCLFNMALSAAQQWTDVFVGKPPRLLINPEAFDKFAKRFEIVFGISVKGAA
jgi:D-3-phosphoglycerate dehydrogenase